jgi:flagellar protein FliT
MQFNHIIQEYTNLANLMSQMLDAAQRNDWDNVSELEVAYLAQVNQIKQLEPTEKLDKASKSQKLAIIKQILADDHAIRLLIHPWMNKLSQLMQPRQTHAIQTKLNNTYRM